MRISLLLLVPLVVLAGCSSSRSSVDQSSIGDSTPRSYTEIIDQSSAADWSVLDPEHTLYVELPDGMVVVALSEHLASDHADQMRKLARSGYFDGLRFYRVIEGFVAQAGVRGEGRQISGGAADSLIAEFDEPTPANLPFVGLGNSDGYADEVGFSNGLPTGRDNATRRSWLTHCTGALAYARSGRPNSAAATIYITLQPQRYLDRNLSVVGQVVWGMEHVQAITRAFPDEGGIIADKARQTPIVSMRVAADVPLDERINLEIFDTNSTSFPELVESRRNRPESFFVYRPDYIDLCQMPVPVRIHKP